MENVESPYDILYSKLDTPNLLVAERKIYSEYSILFYTYFFFPNRPLLESHLSHIETKVRKMETLQIKILRDVPVKTR